MSSMVLGLTTSALLLPNCPTYFTFLMVYLLYGVAITGYDQSE